MTKDHYNVQHWKFDDQAKTVEAKQSSDRGRVRKLLEIIDTIYRSCFKQKAMSNYPLIYSHEYSENEIFGILFLQQTK